MIDFVPRGKKYRLDFGDTIFDLSYESDTKLTYYVVKAPWGNDYSETVDITVREIRPKVYMIYWQEKDKTTVVHVEDFENNIVYTNITGHGDGVFTNLKGTMTEIPSR